MDRLQRGGCLRQVEQHVHVGRHAHLEYVCVVLYALLLLLSSARPRGQLYLGKLPIVVDMQ